MEKCKNCGKPKMPDDPRVTNYWEYGNYCDGVMSLNTDPYAEEINDDHTLYWDCDGGRHESAMDI